MVKTAYTSGLRSSCVGWMKTSPERRGGEESITRASTIKSHSTSAAAPPRLLTQFIEARLHSVLPDHRADQPSLQERRPAVHQGFLPSFIILDRVEMRLGLGSTSSTPPPPQR